MPRFDRTGPGGMGPMTGRGMGFCNPVNNYDPANNYKGIPSYLTHSYSTYGAYYGRPRWGMRYGGLGRGRGLGRGYYPYY